MNAPTIPTVPADDYQAEAHQLVEWLFGQAAFYRKHAPACASDIQNFEDAAALIDSFRAGLVLVDPHPAMHAELIRWVSVADCLPAEDELVLLWRGGDDSPWVGYRVRNLRRGDHWCGADGMPFDISCATHWASMPAGPAPAPAVEAHNEEAQP